MHNIPICASPMETKGSMLSFYYGSTVLVTKGELEIENFVNTAKLKKEIYP